MHRVLPAALVVAILSATSMAAQAEGTVPELRKAYRTACKADIERFCAAAEKKGACLKQHMAEITPDCKTARKAYRTARKAPE